MKKLLSLFLVVILMTGCASIVSKSSYPISFKTSPVASDISISNQSGKVVFEGRTPTTAMLKAHAGFFVPAKYKITFHSEGYESKTISINAKLDGWYFGNILFGGLIGILIVDPATGAMYKLDEQYVHQSLIEMNYENLSEMNIYDINNIPEEWNEKLVQIKTE